MLQCERCQRPITFRQTVNRKWVPYDPEGSCHFDTCPDRDPRFRLIHCLECPPGYGWCETWEDWVNHSRVSSHRHYGKWSPRLLDG